MSMPALLTGIDPGEVAPYLRETSASAKPKLPRRVITDFDLP